MKKITILGSTGSVGTQALDIARHHKERIKIIGLSANTNVDLILKQIIEFKPTNVAMMNKKSAKELKSKLKNLNNLSKRTKVLSGIKGITELACNDQTNLVLTAFVGSIGIIPTIEAIKKRKTIALANKETLVTAGEIVMKLTKEKFTDIIPVDSEHSAIFQCLMDEKPSNVKNIVLTCSGGPFRTTPKNKLKNITVNQALNHPSWSMGGKITINSSTLMNKGLEIIEAHHLFNIPYKQIKVLVHPQSLIHSLVEFKDNSYKAQIGAPTMYVPIQLAFTYPKRLKTQIIPKLNLLDFNKMTFELPDYDKFPALNFAFEAGRQGGTMPAVLNAANEIAVDKFLKGKLKYLDIIKTVEKAMQTHKNIKNPSLDDILSVDKETRTKLKNTKKIKF